VRLSPIFIELAASYITHLNRPANRGYPQTLPLQGPTPSRLGAHLRALGRACGSATRTRSAGWQPRSSSLPISRYADSTTWGSVSHRPRDCATPTCGTAGNVHGFTRWLPTPGHRKSVGLQKLAECGRQAPRIPHPLPPRTGVTVAGLEAAVKFVMGYEIPCAAERDALRVGEQHEEVFAEMAALDVRAALQLNSV
jgi:hypothetical protein